VNIPAWQVQELSTTHGSGIGLKFIAALYEGAMRGRGFTRFAKPPITGLDVHPAFGHA
jgi:hypothetical protein